MQPQHHTTTIDPQLIATPLRHDPFPRMADVLRPCANRTRTVQVRHVEITPEAAQFENLRFAIRGQRAHMVAPGRYAVLDVHGQVMMSDTPYERRTNQEAAERLRGNVLIAGLGLGMLPLALAQVRGVSSLTIVELQRDVIECVMPQLLRYSPRFARLLTLHCADAFTWQPPRGVRYDGIFLDIWPTVCGDNVKQITTLRRRFSRWLSESEDSWLGVWEEDSMRAEAGSRRRR